MAAGHDVLPQTPAQTLSPTKRAMRVTWMNALLTVPALKVFTAYQVPGK